MSHPELTELNPQNIVTFIGGIFERCGSEEYLGEPVTMAEHMLQGATLAERKGMPDEIIVAALLHDIGHFTSELGTFSMADTEDRHHEEAGARLLQAFFPSVITDCVRYHVAAKRYLCAINTDYYDSLSTASVHSLYLQGGPMGQEEIEEFEKNPNLKQIIQVRYLDDAGKSPAMKTADFWHFAPLVQHIVDRHCEFRGHNT